MCGFFEISVLAQKKWKEIRFKSEIWQKFTCIYIDKKISMGITFNMNWEQIYKLFPYNFFSMGITYKMNPDQILREFSCLFSRR